MKNIELENMRWEYELHGLTRFRDWYGIGVGRIYEAFGKLGHKGYAKNEYPMFEDDGSSISERRERFYSVTGQIPVRRGGRTLAERNKKTLEIAEAYREKMAEEPTPEPYTGIFAFAFHKL